jgi:hypothetical protein
MMDVIGSASDQVHHDFTSSSGSYTYRKVPPTRVAWKLRNFHYPVGWFTPCALPVSSQPVVLELSWTPFKRHEARRL